MAFLFFPGVVWFDPVMRPLLSLIRVPQRACEQEPVLLGRVSFTEGQIEWGLRLRIHSVSRTNRKPLSEFLHPSGPQFPCQMKGSPEMISSFLLVSM